MSTVYKNPRADYPGKMVLGIIDPDILSDKATRGTYRQISAEEPFQAAIIRIGEDIEKGVSADDLKIWQTMLLSAPVEYKKLKCEDDFFWEASLFRKKLADDFAVCGLSHIQLMCVIMNYKSKQEKAKKPLSAKELSQQYNQRVGVTPGTDAVSDTFIDTASTVHSRLFSDEICRAIVLKCEQTNGKKGPFASIYKIEVHIRKSDKDIKKLRWSLQHNVTLLEDKEVEREIPMSDLLGKKSGNKGLIDLWIMKKALLTELLTNIPVSIGFDAGTVESMRGVLESHDKYRKHFGIKGEAADLSWMQAFTEPEKSYVRLVKDTVYGVKYDGPIKLGVKSGKNAPSILEHDDFSQMFEKLTNEMQDQSRGHAATTVSTTGTDDGLSFDDEFAVAAPVFTGKQDEYEKAVDKLKMVAQQNAETLHMHMQDYIWDFASRFPPMRGCREPGD